MAGGMIRHTGLPGRGFLLIIENQGKISICLFNQMQQEIVQAAWVLLRDKEPGYDGLTTHSTQANINYSGSAAPEVTSSGSYLTFP